MTHHTYSTTRLLTQEIPDVSNNPEDKFETLLFLPDEENRKGEGGLRTKGYFKKPYDEKPLISIITVVYNGEKYLEETIQSIISQTYDNVEYIIIDGGSTDGTVDIIKKYEDAIDYWVSEKDKGIYDAMNKGIILAQGDIIGLLNADDIYHPFALSAILNTYLYQKIDAVFYGIAKFVINNEVIKSIEKDFDIDRILRGFGFLHTTCFVPRSLYQSIGLFDTSYKIAGDTDFLLRCYLNKTPFVKAQNITYMRLGGVSDRMMLNANREFLEQIKKYHLKSVREIRNYRLLFIMAIPLLKLRNNPQLKHFFIQLKFFLITSMNFVYACLPGFKLKKLFLKLVGIQIGDQSYIHHGCKLFDWSKIIIGDNVSIGPRCYLDNRRGILIGNNVAIAHDCKIYTLGHDNNSPFMESKGNNVIIEDDVFIYSNVLIMPNVKIAQGAIVYPGSVVTKDLGAFSINSGNPAQEIKSRQKQILYKNQYGYHFAL